MNSQKVSFIVTHGEDCDGIIAATLLRSASNSEVIEMRLIKYPMIIDTLRSAPDGCSLSIADIGQDEKTVPEFAKEIKRVMETNGSVTYIDHHPWGIKYEDDLRLMGATVVHERTDCAAVLAWHTNEKTLSGHHFRFLAAMGAVADYQAEGRYASLLVPTFDRISLYTEMGLLAYTITNYAESNNREALVRMTRELATKAPHELDGAMEATQEALINISRIKRDIAANAVVIGNVAFYETNFSTGAVVNLIKEVRGVPVTVAYKKQDGKVKVSLRSLEPLTYDLHEIVPAVSEKLGVTGGGHPAAAGMDIDVNQIPKMINTLAAAINDRKRID